MTTDNLMIFTFVVWVMTLTKYEKNFTEGSNKLIFHQTNLRSRNADL